MTINRGTIRTIPFISSALEEEIELLVYLPSNYSPLYKYSVLIAQDGKDYFQMGKIARFADELLAKSEIENIIIVGIPYQNSRDRWEKYHPEGSKQQAYIRFLAHELAPYLDEEFSTYNMGMSRALIGDSLAGTVSLLAAIQYPNTFGKVALHSPLVNDTVLEQVTGFAFPYLLQIYHVIGKLEVNVPTTAGKREDFLSPNRELNLLFESQGFPTFYEEFDGDHTWTYWQPDVKRTLTTLFSK